MSDLDTALDAIVARRMAPVLQALNDLRQLVSGEPQRWLSIGAVQARCGCGRARIMSAIAGGHLAAAEQSDARGRTPKLRITVADCDSWGRRGFPT